MGDTWKNGEENNRNVWREVRKRCVDIERQNMEATMRVKGSLVFYNELNSNWEKKLYKDFDKLQKTGLYLSKYKEKWKRLVRKYEEV
jgi:hypothetical protein